MAISKTTKKAVAERANYNCEYCFAQSFYTQDSFCTEHILPISKGGTDELDNLAFSCYGCNSYKYNHTEAIDPINGSKVPLFNPRIEQWSDHFKWSKDKTEVIGISPIGRATVVRLKLNRKELVNLRAIFVMVGKHPPG